MKVKHLLVSTMAVCGLLTGCLSEPDFEPVVEGGIPINLDGSISQVSTKVNAQGFEDNDALGLYAVNYENSNQTPGTLLDEGNQADHVKYILDESTGKWTPVRPVYYKDVNTNVDLYVFYPHAEPASVSAYNFEVQKDQSTAERSGKLAGYEASDFMWTKVEGVVPTESAIQVTLQHKMAGVHVILKEGTGFDVAGDWDLVDKKVLVTNTTRKATIDLSTGEVSPVGGAQATGIVMAPQTDGSFRAIVVPQTVDAGTPVLNITVGGVAYDFYDFKTGEAFTYESGKLNQFTITVNRKTATGEYEFELADTQIVDWKEDINTHEGEARQYYCVHLEEPGTLGDLIRADGKNPDKIRNLKVSGKIHAGDFYFIRDSMAIVEAVNMKEAIITPIYVVDLEGYPTGKRYVVCVDSEPENIYELINNIYHDEIEGIGYFVNEWAQEHSIPPLAFKDKKTLYYFSFPEQVSSISREAFAYSSISGALVIPDSVTAIGENAFAETNTSSLTLPQNLREIHSGAFSSCKSLSGTLSLPESLVTIGDQAFMSCGFSGTLTLPDALSYIGNSAFSNAGQFIGNLRIPDKITSLKGGTFSSSGFTGTLDLNNVREISSYDFNRTGFQGELLIPEGVQIIPRQAFSNTDFSSIVFSDGLKTIGLDAFSSCYRLSTISSFPEGMISIGQNAFFACRALQSIEIPSSLQTIQTCAFQDCVYLNKITSHAVEPPTVQSGAFNGVPKDNFVLEVPENAVARYLSDSEWSKFRTISAHYDFAISRPLARSLNAETSKTYILDAPANHSWSIESKPEWITVTPEKGTGKASVTVTFSELDRSSSETFDYELYDDYGYYQGAQTYKGRSGEIIFKLDDKDYTSVMKVEQFNSEHADGDVYELNRSTTGNGIDLVFLGDCYDAKDIAEGTYLEDLQEAFGYFFDVQPYKAYKDYFNVYAVFGESNDSGMGTVNTVKDAKFGSQYSLEGISPDFETAYEYARKAAPSLDPTKTLIVMIENTTEYGGITYMWGDGTAIACCPKSDDAYPYDFRGLVQHEAGGHGFGKLADEYIYHNAFIQSCSCPCCVHLDDLLAGKALGWYRNLEATGDINEVGWSHLIFNPQYSDVVDVYEGGYFHSRGVYRSEPTSCMNNNIPYFSAISRQAIVERIMEYAGEEFTLENFYANDSDEFGATTKSAGFNTIPVETYFGGQQHAPVYMGDKPDFLK